MLLVGKVRGSARSVYSQSRPCMYSPESLKATFSDSLVEWRRLVRMTDRSPPSTDRVVPCEVKGDLVMRCSTPAPLLGP